LHGINCLLTLFLLVLVYRVLSAEEQEIHTGLALSTGRERACAMKKADKMELVNFMIAMPGKGDRPRCR